MVLNIWIIKLGKNHTKSEMLSALAWYYANDSIGSKDTAVMLYKDRLSTFKKYIDRIYFKKYHRNRNLVNQGIIVYGNKSRLTSIHYSCAAGLKTLNYCELNAKIT